MRNVLFAAPFPRETTYRFVRATARLHGVRLLGVVGESPQGADARLFADQVRVADPLDAQQLLDAARTLVRRHGPLHRIVGVLEPLQETLAAVREVLGVPGMDTRTTALFRDKGLMKDALRKAGLPCARHAVVDSFEAAQRFAGQVGWPLVLKPPAGMGAKTTWRVQNLTQLQDALRAMGASPQRPVIAEEFLRGREFSFETITIQGKVHFTSASRYLPTPLEVLENPWMQWAVFHPRSIQGAPFDAARTLGTRAIAALGLRTAFTHMEWFQREDGSLAIGEIAARPPGAQIVSANNYVHDIDLYRAWARAMVDEAYDGPWERKYAVGVAFLRGMGRGRVLQVQGIDRMRREAGHLIVAEELPRFGTPRADTYEGDGYVIVRHHDDEVVMAALKVILENVRVTYG